MAFHPAGAAAAGAGETIHLHCTDREGEWLVRRDAEGLTVTREHAKGDVAARGTASDLLLVLQSRLPVSAVECFGDDTILERWQREVSF
jgi:predicted lipid carrier protein YhbT